MSDLVGNPEDRFSYDATHYFTGLASSGGSCTKANEPSVFEDVSQYAAWIKRTMEDAKLPYPY